MIEQVNQGISNTLYQISSALLLPVMIAVVLLFAAALVMVGGFVREALERRRTRAAVRKATYLASSDARAPAIWDALGAAPSGLPRRMGRRAAEEPVDAIVLNKVLIDLEGDVANSLGRIGFLTRVGPMLGLLGTLIPFGPALAGLSSGDIQELSGNLITAFATTVVGLLCGSLAYGVSCWRRAWYAKDLDDLEYLVKLITEANAHATTQEEMGGNGRRPDLRIGEPV